MEPGCFRQDTPAVLDALPRGERPKTVATMRGFRPSVGGSRLGIEAPRNRVRRGALDAEFAATPG